MKIVLVQPFHNEEEVKAREVIERDIENLGLKDISSKVIAHVMPYHKILELELQSFQEADVVIVNIDNKLPGVMIMLGAVFAINSTTRVDNKSKVFTYSLNGYGTNPFITSMTDGHFSSYEELLIKLSTL